MRIRLVNTKLVKPRLKKRIMFFQINFKPISDPDKQQNAPVFRMVIPKLSPYGVGQPSLERLSEVVYYHSIYSIYGKIYFKDLIW